ncbi:MAG: XisI protein [Limnoraphis robusta]|uniref:FdxN element excision controlling factor protein n=2 Tax=Limnoraphis robusta TaxID=1118279 RepID=A0A0F5YGR5_9CYAN|nr:XisI protein [Limnoraphis robusta]ACC85640.1 XisI [Limnoraphis robusta CCAP 1446/4]KKD38079.1 FdxN element excision controlling factor protein [Limnoraphis robusta CS-951]
METSNKFLDEWRNQLEKILQYYADLPYRYGDVVTSLIVSRDCNHFLLIHEGWENNLRVHGCIVHAEIRNDKIWIHYDGIEDGITDELVAAGVPKDHIVLAFHPPEVRQYTGYAIA